MQKRKRCVQIKIQIQKPVCGGLGIVEEERENTAPEAGERSGDFGTRSQVEISGEVNENQSEDH